MENSKTKRLRFTYNDDLCFLREVVAENPFDGDVSSWESVQRNLQIATGKLFTLKTLKNHLEHMLEMFLKKDAVDKVRSGIEEPYCERDHLVQEVAIISSEYRENNLKKKKHTSKDKQISDLGKKAREKYALSFANQKEIPSIESDDILADPVETPVIHEVIHEEIVGHDDHTYANDVDHPEPPNGLVLVPGTSSTPQADVTTCEEAGGNVDVLPTSNDAPTPALKKKIIGPTRTRPRKEASLRKNAISYLTEKHARDRQIRERELELESKKIDIENRKLLLEEEKLKLEKRKIELEAAEREERLKIEKQKLSLEIEEKKVTTQLLLAQQTIINKFIKDFHL